MTMIHRSTRRLILGFVLALVSCVSLRAQENTSPRISRDVVSSLRTPEPSDLAKENLERVAASTIELKAIFLRDPGLLVELKRWVAKETTDYGQIVEDSTLTDQAIFERLDRDVAFRSVATRLVQRYGYLLPSVNPDSDLGKEQDLVLKERARRLVQIEAEEDSLSLQPKGTDENQGQRIERASCDPRRQDNCPEPSSKRGKPDDSQTPGVEPDIPDMQQQTPPASMARTLRASTDREDPGLQNFAGTTLNTALSDHSAESALDDASHAQKALLPAMEAVRAAADKLEAIVADDLWPLPTYQEMLYVL